MKNKRNVIILSASLALIMASILMLVVYFVFLKPDSEDEGTFTITCQNMSVLVGEKIEIQYAVSNDDAEVIFEVENKEIASINNSTLTALKPGTTLVFVTATVDDKIAYDSFYLTVSREDCYVEIVAISNCVYQNQTLFVEGDSCQFSLNLYDTFDNLIDNPDCVITTSPNLAITTLPFGYLLSATGNGEITFTFDLQNYSQTIKVQTL